MPAVFPGLLLASCPTYSTTFSPQSPPGGTIHRPFVDTDPLRDVMLALLLTPVWWWLGVEAVYLASFVRHSPPLRFFIFSTGDCE